jgi:hypothetical protein
MASAPRGHATAKLTALGLDCARQLRNGAAGSTFPIPAIRTRVERGLIELPRSAYILPVSCHRTRYLGAASSARNVGRVVTAVTIADGVNRSRVPRESDLTECPERGELGRNVHAGLPCGAITENAWPRRHAVTRPPNSLHSGSMAPAIRKTVPPVPPFPFPPVEKAPDTAKMQCFTSCSSLSPGNLIPGSERLLKRNRRKDFVNIPSRLKMARRG